MFVLLITRVLNVWFKIQHKVWKRGQKREHVYRIVIRWFRLRPQTWWFVNPREECCILLGNWIAMQISAFLLRIDISCLRYEPCSSIFVFISIEQQTCSQDQSEPCLTHSIGTELALSADYCLLGQFNKQDEVVDNYNSKTLYWRVNFMLLTFIDWFLLSRKEQAELFSFTLLLFSSAWFQQLLVFSSPIGFDVTLWSMKLLFALLSPSDNYYLSLRIHTK